MPWKSSGPNIGESRVAAIEAICREAIPDLNAAISANSTVAYLIADPHHPLTTTNVDQGDLEIMPSVEQGVIQIRVEGGGFREGVNSSSRIAYFGGGSGGTMEDTFLTSVYGYLHQDAFRNANGILQARKREIALQILSDWLRARVLNYVGVLSDGITTVNRKWIQLASQERHADGANNALGGQAKDVLSDCVATTGHIGYFQRQYGNSNPLYGVSFNHQGVIR